MAHLLGKKIGMTRVYTEDGTQVPVTVLQAGPCFVSQLKSEQNDGYSAVQIAYGEIKPRRSTMQLIAHDAKAGVAPMRHHREFRVTAEELAEFELGQELSVEVLEQTMFVDVIATSKGKGFQGTMKRYNFKGQLASHGVERKHRSPGSINSHGQQAGGPGGPKKGKKMSGHMGAVRATNRSMQVIRIVKDKNLILVKGTVPGPKDGLVEIRPAARLYRSKANVLQAS